ncbi:hypothetical protein LTR62_004226 [Meristemomyces frigidus]|uniref:Uncharacterized protein n=1 Tax=Meristemomyces frigidus TaxID=1508187 RepID=A0AAN7YRG2_9PEZI|nr:hypothetical protein LTR62_004226 [Meristemomyces frigidus]
MRQAVTTLFAQIELHVQNYYARRGHALSESDVQRLEQFECRTLPAPATVLLARPDAVLPTITHTSKACYTHWKQLTTYLYPFSDTNPSQQRQFELASNHIADLIQSVFSPWQSDLKLGDAERRNCIGLCKTTARLGHLIVSQPAGYAFQWDKSPTVAGEEKGMLVLPSFW